MKKQLILIFTAFAFSVAVLASNDHPHDVRRQSEIDSRAQKQNTKQHSEEEEGHSDDHKKVPNENSQVNPSKGITEASAEDGFKLSSEAEKNFEIQRKKITLKNTVEVSESAIVTAGTERNLFRYRNGFYKRIDFTATKINAQTISISSKELSANDEIVIAGMGFLRIAEIAAFGGAPEGHSH